MPRLVRMRDTGCVGSVAGDLSIGVLLLSWGVGAPGSLFAALTAFSWFGAPVAEAQAHQTPVYLAVAVALSLAAPIGPRGCAVDRGLTLSLLDNGYLLSLAAR